MNKVSLCFVVLHYNTVDDTERFITSVFDNIDTESYQIVIVDNASPNGSGKTIKRRYKDSSKISVLLNDANLGFAKGNNVGIAYAEKNFNPDFIVMTNSDTYLVQKDFYSQIRKEYETSNFFVLGPQIITPRGVATTQAQIRQPYDRKRTRQMIRSMKDHLIVNYCGMAKFLGEIRKHILKAQKTDTKISNMDERRENVYLEGACLIFSRDYINVYHGINPRTYMYFEEEILFYEMVRDKRKIVYNPSVKIFHNSHGATETVYNERRKYMIFRCKNQLKSAKVLLDIIDGKFVEDKVEKVQ